MKWGTKHPPPFTRYLALTPDNRIPLFVYVEMFVVMWLYLELRPRDKVRRGDQQPVFWTNESYKVRQKKVFFKFLKMS